MTTIQIFVLCWIVAGVFGTGGVYVGVRLAEMELAKTWALSMGGLFFDDSRIERIERVLFASPLDTCFKVTGAGYVGVAPSLSMAYRNWLEALDRK